MADVVGFTVEISGEGIAPEVDGAWESVTGGGLRIDEACASGTDQTHTTTPGHKYVDSLTLRGPLTSGRTALTDWINDTVQGKPWKRTVTIKEILKDGTDGKTFTYHDCFPVRYTYPCPSADGTGNLYEEIEIKPIRLELA